MPKHYKHSDKRPYIPSAEEEGYEYGNPKVQEKKKTEYPRNPIVHRGQDPELFWLGKYGMDDSEDTTTVDIRSVYRHEHIHPEALMERLYQVKENAPQHQLDLFESLGNEYEIDELEKVGEYYKHQNDWKNRLILGDSILVMNSLLEREGFAGKVQMVYIDPPYGINYSSNWQKKLSSKQMSTSNPDVDISSEPEMIKAYRDTWELGIHSYLGYLRDRLLVSKELLTDSGSCFVQISEENVHLVRCLMDEVFGSDNFISLICFSKTGGLGSNFLYGIFDFIIWYGKNKDNTKYRQLYLEKEFGSKGTSKYIYLELENGKRRLTTNEERINPELLPKGSKAYRLDNLTSQGNKPFPFEFEGKVYRGGWKTNIEGLKRLASKNRIVSSKNSLNYVRYIDDFRAMPINNYWKVGGIQSRSDPKVYTVQTSTTAIQRCLLMATDPGDLTRIIHRSELISNFDKIPSRFHKKLYILRGLG